MHPRLIITAAVTGSNPTKDAMGILLGGHIRVGFEDNLYLRKGVLAESNARFVEMAVQLARHLQLEIATPEEARQMLGIR